MFPLCLKAQDMKNLAKSYSKSLTNFILQIDIYAKTQMSKVF